MSPKPPMNEIEGRIVEAMRGQGFTVNQSRVYLALLKDHPATGYELASKSGVPRSAIYTVLRRLEGLGLVNTVQAKPARYVPLAPERLFNLLQTRFERSLDGLKETLSGLNRPKKLDVTWTIQGYSTILEHAEALISGAQQSVHASVWAREAQRLQTPLTRATEGGIDVVLFSFNPLPPGLGRVLSYDIAAADLEPFWPHKIILVADHSRALVGGADESDDVRAVVSEEPALIEMALSNLVLDITLLGERTQTSTTDVVTQLTRHLAPVDELLAK